MLPIRELLWPVTLPSHSPFLTFEILWLANGNDSWIKSTSGIWDLTQSAREPTTSTGTYTVPCHGSRKNITVEASRSALVIIDMQSISPFLPRKCWYLGERYASVEGRFLSPCGIKPRCHQGKSSGYCICEMINGFSQAEMKVLGTNVNLSPFSPLQMRVLIR